MPQLEAPDEPDLLPLENDDLFLVFDAIDTVLDSNEPCTKGWLAEIYSDGKTLRHRFMALRRRIGALLN